MLKNCIAKTIFFTVIYDFIIAIVLNIASVFINREYDFAILSRFHYTDFAMLQLFLEIYHEV